MTVIFIKKKFMNDNNTYRKRFIDDSNIHKVLSINISNIYKKEVYKY
jgi:hypothetical protein